VAADDEARWQRRTGLARVLRLAVLAGPVAASFAASWLTLRLLPPADGLADKAVLLAVLVAVSTVALLLVDRLGRRALPLATLLDLSMLFPDRAPSRLRVAREAIRRRPIEEQLRRVQDAGADPGAVAREILTLVAALRAHDRPTRGHAERVRMFTDLLAEQLKVPARDRDLLRWAAILHDIGKLRVPASLLNKPGKPTDAEWALLKAHPAHGAEMAAALLPWLGEWGEVIVQHHERYDGTGYPEGLAGDRISLGGRIVSVADAYDVMTAARAYKRPVSRAAALRELVRCSGSQFDPAVVRAMVAVGAPRLRRAQGLVAWLADVPLVATSTVPTATLARAVGAGALATGAVTGGVVVDDGLLPRADARTVATRDASPERVAGDDRGRTSQRAVPGPAGRPVTPRQGGSGAGTAPAPTAPAPVPAPGATEDVTPATGQTGVAAEPVARGQAERPADTDGPPPSAEPGGTGSGAGPGGAGTKPSVRTDPVGAVTTTVEDVVSDPVGTVTGTVGATTDKVGEVVSDPVGTVEDVVSDPVGTVTGTLDDVLSGGGRSPAPSPSPTSGGLLGGLLGR
jgi:putative nucleotidyltransferase with HDIG domain